MPATTPLTYNALITQVCLLAPYQYTGPPSSAVVTPQAPEFTAVIPQMLNYAEQRIQRDLELMATQTAKGGYALTQGYQWLSVPPADFVVVQDVYVQIAGVWTPMNSVSVPYLNYVWPGGSAPAPPKVYAMAGGDLATAGLTGNMILFGPPPDAPYQVSLYGTQRAPSLETYANPTQAGVSTTWISTWLPDLLVMACMIYVSAYQRDFGRQSDDPQMALSYEQQYQTLLGAVDKEEYRKRHEADAWSARAPSPTATPTRT